MRTIATAMDTKRVRRSKPRLRIRSLTVFTWCMKENFIGASNLPFSAAPPPVNERGTAVWWDWPQRKRRGLCGSIFLRDGFQTAAERRIWSGTGEREAFFLKPRSAFPIVADLCRKCKAQFPVKTDRCGYRANSVHYIIFLF